MKRSINIKGTALDLSIPKVMGILNVTPDSFSDGGQFSSVETALNQAVRMQEEGASIIDVGGYSSRPGADDVTVQEEIDRVSPVIEKIAKESEIYISIDTFRAEVARQAIRAGAHIINDISAGEDDNTMLSTVSALGVPYIAMHKQGVPLTMQVNPNYDDVVNEVYGYLKSKVLECRSAGIADIIIDPGFGFGKTIEHNFQLLSSLSKFQEIDVPLLAGISRKSTIYKTLDVLPNEAVNGTTFLHAFALLGGANILRVHDVKEAMECTKLWNRMKG